MTSLKPTRTCMLTPGFSTSRHRWLEGVAVLANGWAEVIPEELSCCAALGRLESQDRSSAWLCEMWSRLTRLRELMQRFAAVWPAEELKGPVNWRHWDAHLAESTNQARPMKGKVLVGSADEPSPCWSIAAMAVWHWGLSCQVVCLRRGRYDSLATSDWEVCRGSHGILMVEGLELVPSTAQVFALELLINQAYNSESQLWLAVPKASAANAEAIPGERLTSATSKLRRQFAEEQRKSGGAFSWLSSAARERLAGVCDLA